MDAHVFLSAQLWLHRRPPDAWPGAEANDARTSPPAAASTTTTLSTVGNAPSAEKVTSRTNKEVDRGTRIILRGARCCFLAEDSMNASSTMAAYSSGKNDELGFISSRERPLVFSHRRAEIKPGQGHRDRHRCAKGHNGGLQAEDTSSVPGQEVRRRGQDNLSYCFEDNRSGNNRYGIGHANGQGGSADGMVAMPSSPTCSEVTGGVSVKSSFKFGLAISTGTDFQPAIPAAQKGTGRDIEHEAGVRADGHQGGEERRRTAASGQDKLPPSKGQEAVKGNLLLRVDGVVYEAEHTLIKSIAYPKSRGIGRGKGAFGDHGKSKEGTIGGEGEDEQVHRKNDCSESSSNAAAAVRSKHDLGDGDDEYVCNAKGRGGKKPRLSSSAAQGASSAAGDNEKDVNGQAGDGPPCAYASAASTATRRCRGSFPKSGDKCYSRDGIDNDRVTRGPTRDEVSAAEDVVRASTREGIGVTFPEAAADRKEAEEEDGVFGDGESVVGLPFCGLLFPGVMLKFWLPRHQRAVDDTIADSRDEAVERLQGVISDMLNGLTATAHGHSTQDDHHSRASDARQASDRLHRTGPGHGDDRCERMFQAWDEFVYGSRTLLLQEHSTLLRHHQERQHRSHQGQQQFQQRYRGTDGRHEWISSTTDVGRSNSINSRFVDVRAGETIPRLRTVDEGACSERLLGDVGRARALTALAERFSQAQTPLSVMSAAQRRLQEAKSSAGRALEAALDRAFPLDLSQGTGGDARVSTVSELEACCSRVRAAEEALLPLALLPTSKMLHAADDNDDDA